MPTAPDSTRFYFAVALSICWIALLPPSLAALGVIPGPADDWMAGAPLAVFSPTIAAVLAARREGGWPAVREMLAGLRAWRFGVLWLVLAITLSGLSYAAARAVYALAVGGDDVPWVGWPERPEHVAGMFVVPIAEEIGWRGYALPRLLKAHGAHRATGILSVYWALWHVPMFVAVGHTLVGVVLSLAFIAVGNVSFTWLYRRGGGSLLLAVLYHFGAHLDSPSRGVVDDQRPMILHLAGMAVLAIGVLALDRRAWEGTTPEAPGTPSARS